MVRQGCCDFTPLNEFFSTPLNLALFTRQSTAVIVSVCCNRYEINENPNQIQVNLEIAGDCRGAGLKTTAESAGKPINCLFIWRLVTGSRVSLTHSFTELRHSGDPKRAEESASQPNTQQPPSTDLDCRKMYAESE